MSKRTLCGDLSELRQPFVSLSSNQVLCLVSLKIQSAEAKTDWEWTARNHELWSKVLSETMGNRHPLNGSHFLGKSELLLLLHCLGIRYFKMLAREADCIIWQILTLSVATRASAYNFQGTTKVFTEQINTPLFFLHTWDDSSWGKCLSVHFHLCFLDVNIKVQGKSYSDAHQ